MSKKIFQDSFSILKLKFKFKIQGRPWSDASALENSENKSI